MSPDAVPTTRPYGSWPSPITAGGLAVSGHPVEGGRFVGEEIWWGELRPAEGGRTTIRRTAAAGAGTAAGADSDAGVDVLPGPWNARTRVHEYGGGAWTVVGDGILVFAEFSDQRLYRLDPGAGAPVPLTPAPPETAAWRYADIGPSPDGSEIWCVREVHTAGRVERDIAAVPVDGSAAEDADRVRSLVAGSDFLAYPRPSPDGKTLAWIAWNHPQMPWDGTELRVAAINPDGSYGPPRTLLGSTTESVLQPEWIDAERLYVLSDRTGWWNLYRIGLAGSDPDPVHPAASDFGGPLWTLGTRWYRPLPDGRIVTVRTNGTDRLGLLDPDLGELTDIELGDLTSVRLADFRDGRLALVAGGAQTPAGLRTIDVTAGAAAAGVRSIREIRRSVEGLPDAAYLPEARAMRFGSSREVHAIVYEPRSPDSVGPAGERPPYIAFVHGGPTAHVAPVLNLVFAYFTSRGIGVVDVNYGGSTGYGREYRERLRGQWGVVDVEDTVAVMHGLVDAGLADPHRLAIEGGSAGGWTVLSALTATDVFACGASYFGVAELVDFAADTHDFESRYLDGLIGPFPEERALYESRAPVNHVDQLSCPVLLLQGLDDPIVPPSQSEKFRDAMVAKGIPHAYLAYAGESHGFRKAATIISAREAELSFYGQIMGFDTPGVPALELWRADAAEPAGEETR